MPEEQPQENNNASSWADFKPPVLTAPFGDGGVVSPGLTVPQSPNPAPADPPISADPPLTPPVTTEPEPTHDPPVEADPPAPTATSELPVPSLPTPPTVEAPVVTTPAPDEPSQSELVTEAPPVTSPEASVDTSPTPETKSEVTAAEEPAPEAKPEVKVEEPAPPPPEVQAPEPPAPPVVTPIETPVPTPVVTTVAASPQKVGILMLVLIILAGIGGGGYYAYAQGLLSWPSNFPQISLPFTGSSTPAVPAVTENQSILAQAVGPATWENNYSTDLLPTEKGGLDFQVTDPASPGGTSSVAAEASSSATLVDATSLRSLVIKIAKVEVHLVTQSVVATGTDPASAKSADKPSDHWETLRIDGNALVDLIALRTQGGGVSSLGVTYLAAGHYTEVRLYVTGATAVTTDGQTASVSIPGNSGIVKIVRSFDVTTTGTKALLIDFDAGQIIQKIGDSYQLQPVVGRVLFDGKPI